MDDIREAEIVDVPAEETPTEAIAPAPAQNSLSLWAYNDWNDAVKKAKILASSDLVPAGTYKGKPANCLIALDMAQRTGLSPMYVMQNLYIIQGRPSWSGQFCVTAINGCGRFSPLEFIRLVDGDGDLQGYYAQATRISDGKICEGPAVTWETVKGEGWYDKSGSKWKTMPDLMFRYRCAAFFARTFCPDVLNGLQTADEVRDVHGYGDEQTVTIKRKPS